jgi:N-acetylglucosamine malate deacetylase 1
MRVLAISTHPDDETLGCGGTLLRHAAEGDELHWLVITAPAEGEWSPEIITGAAEQVNRVGEAYGMRQVFKSNMPTTHLDTIPQNELINSIRSVIAQVTPHTVYLVHEGDVHTDHRAVFIATLSVLKSFYMTKWNVHRIMSYETLSSTEAAAPAPARAFVPNVYSDISPYLERKIEIMNIFKTERQDELLPRGDSAIRALARYRGATIGVEYAEAFQLIREVV